LGRKILEVKKSNGGGGKRGRGGKLKTKRNQAERCHWRHSKRDARRENSRKTEVKREGKGNKKGGEGRRVV